MRFLLALCCVVSSLSAAATQSPHPPHLAKGVPIGQEVEELVGHIVAIDQASGKVLFKEAFTKKIPRAHAIGRAQAALANTFDLVTHQDLEEVNRETYQLRMAGVQPGQEPEKRGFGLVKQSVKSFFGSGAAAMTAISGVGVWLLTRD